MEAVFLRNFKNNAIQNVNEQSVPFPLCSHRFFGLRPVLSENDEILEDLALSI